MLRCTSEYRPRSPIFLNMHGLARNKILAVQACTLRSQLADVKYQHRDLILVAPGQEQDTKRSQVLAVTAVGSRALLRHDNRRVRSSPLHGVAQASRLLTVAAECDDQS